MGQFSPSCSQLLPAGDICSLSSVEKAPAGIWRCSCCKSSSCQEERMCCTLDRCSSALPDKQRLTTQQQQPQEKESAVGAHATAFAALAYEVARERRIETAAARCAADSQPQQQFGFSSKKNLLTAAKRIAASVAGSRLGLSKLLQPQQQLHETLGQQLPQDTQQQQQRELGVIGYSSKEAEQLQQQQLHVPLQQLHAEAEAWLHAKLVEEGSTNILVRVTNRANPDFTCAVKFYGKKSDCYMNREKQLRLLRLLALHGIGKEVFGTFTEYGGGLVESWVPGASLRSDQLLSRAPKIAQRLAAVHALNDPTFRSVYFSAIIEENGESRFQHRETSDSSQHAVLGAGADLSTSASSAQTATNFQKDFGGGFTENEAADLSLRVSSGFSQAEQTTAEHEFSRSQRDPASITSSLRKSSLGSSTEKSQRTPAATAACAPTTVAASALSPTETTKKNNAEVVAHQELLLKESGAASGNRSEGVLISPILKNSCPTAGAGSAFTTVESAASNNGGAPGSSTDRVVAGSSAAASQTLTGPTAGLLRSSPATHKSAATTCAAAVMRSAGATAFSSIREVEKNAPPSELWGLLWTFFSLCKAEKASLSAASFAGAATTKEAAEAPLTAASSSARMHCSQRLFLFDLDVIEKKLREIQALAAEVKSPVVLCHGDLLSGNIIETEEGSIHFIDFEYSGFMERAFDIANHFVEYAGLECDFTQCPNKQQQEHFLRAYAECVVSERLQAVEKPLVQTEALSDSVKEGVPNPFSVCGGERPASLALSTTKAAVSATIQASTETAGVEAVCPHGFGEDVIAGLVEDEVAQLKQEIKPFFTASLLLWGLWALVQAVHARPKEMNYWRFAFDRLAAAISPPLPYLSPY